jgi:hypothetical protein
MRPLENLAERGFLTDPRPESITAIVSGAPHTTLDIGVKIITHTRDGLKIIPCAQIVFALTTKQGEEWIDLFPHTVRRDLVPRLLEMCDAAEARQKSGDK